MAQVSLQAGHSGRSPGRLARPMSGTWTAAPVPCRKPSTPGPRRTTSWRRQPTPSYPQRRATTASVWSRLAGLQTPGSCAGKTNQEQKGRNTYRNTSDSLGFETVSKSLIFLGKRVAPRDGIARVRKINHLGQHRGQYCSTEFLGFSGKPPPARSAPVDRCRSKCS